jgi:hypothetical protein
MDGLTHVGTDKLYQIGCLLCTVASCPHLTVHVRHFVLADWIKKTPRETVFVLDQSRSLTPLVNEHSYYRRDRHYIRLHVSHIALFVVSNLPNLFRLHLSYSSGYTIFPFRPAPTLRFVEIDGDEGSLNTMIELVFLMIGGGVHELKAKRVASLPERNIPEVEWVSSYLSTQ